MTLDQAIRDALARNRALIAARESTGEAAAKMDAARADFFPRVSLSESWQRGDQPVFVFSSLLSARRFAATNFALDALNRPEPVGFFHGVVAVEQAVFDGGRRRAAVQSAASAHDTAAAVVTEAELAVVVAVTDAYGRLLRAHSAARAAAGAAAAAREDVARAERRREAGLGTDADVLSLQVHLADVQQRAIQATGGAAIARAELNRMLGAPITRNVNAVEPTVADVDLGRSDVSALLREADTTRAELRRAEAAVALAQAAAREANAAWWPSVVAQGAYQFDGTRFSDRSTAWVIGGELRWTWSAGGAQRASTRAASHAVARARTELDDARAAVHVEVVSAMHTLAAAEASETVARSAVEQARESERIIRNRFDAGLAGVTDVLRASTAVLDAEARRIAAIVSRVQAVSALRRALGRRPSAAG